MNKVKRIIEIDKETYDRICNAQSVPDMFGTDIVNGLNAIKASTPYYETNYDQGFYDGLNSDNVHDALYGSN